MWRVVCLALLLSLNIHAQQAVSYSQLQVDDLTRQYLLQIVAEHES